MKLQTLQQQKSNICDLHLLFNKPKKAIYHVNYDKIFNVENHTAQYKKTQYIDNKSFKSLKIKLDGELQQRGWLWL